LGCKWAHACFTLSCWKSSLVRSWNWTYIHWACSL
jgi:hypothetical protein